MCVCGGCSGCEKVEPADCRAVKKVGCGGVERPSGFTGCQRRWSQEGMRNERILLSNWQTGFFFECALRLLIHMYILMKWS